MHKCVCNEQIDQSVSSTTDDHCPPAPLMDKVECAIEKLESDLYEIIVCKNKLETVIEKLEKIRHNNGTVVNAVGTRINRVERAIQNCGFGVFLHSIDAQIDAVSALLPCNTPHANNEPVVIE